MARARILEFESDMPSQPVRLKRITYEGRAKIPRYREVSQIGAGLRVQYPLATVDEKGGRRGRPSLFYPCMLPRATSALADISSRNHYSMMRLGRVRAPHLPPFVPAKAGTQRWVPACAGTNGVCADSN